MYPSEEKNQNKKHLDVSHIINYWREAEHWKKQLSIVLWKENMKCILEAAQTVK